MNRVWTSENVDRGTSAKIILARITVVVVLIGKDVLKVDEGRKQYLGTVEVQRWAGSRS